MLMRNFETFQHRVFLNLVNLVKFSCQNVLGGFLANEYFHEIAKAYN